MAGSEFTEEVFVQDINIALAGRLARLQTEIGSDSLQQLHFGKVGIKNQRCGDSFVKTFKQHTTQHRFARPHFSSNFDKPLALVNAIEEMGQGFFMLRAEKQKARIRGKIKRGFSQVEKM